MSLWTKLCAYILIVGATAQESTLCNKTFAAANGTGFFPIEPGIILPTQDYVPNATWAVTLSAGSPVDTTVQSILWYDTSGVNYTDSISLGFDVCAIYFGEGMLKNTYLRSQHDNGSCLTTLDAGCLEAIQQQSEDSAMQLVKSPTYLSDGNLTANSIVGVCDKIAHGMLTALPHQCKPYYNETGYAPYGVALTTKYWGAGADEDCTLKDSNDVKPTFDGIFGFQEAEANTTSHTEYDEYGGSVFPVLTVFLPVADSRRAWSIERASSVTTCLRVTDYNPGSRIPPSQGEPTPVQLTGSGGTTLGKGELAGVVVAAILGTGVLVAIFVWWWLRRRRARRAVTQPLPSVMTDSPAYDKLTLVSSATTEVGNDGARYELPLNSRLTELPDVGSTNPVELDAPIAENRHTERSPY